MVRVVGAQIVNKRLFGGQAKPEAFWPWIGMTVLPWDRLRVVALPCTKTWQQHLVQKALGIAVSKPCRWLHRPSLVWPPLWVDALKDPVLL